MSHKRKKESGGQSAVDEAKPKSAQDIQREMAKWERKQEKLREQSKPPPQQSQQFVPVSVASGLPQQHQPASSGGEFVAGATTPGNAATSLQPGGGASIAFNLRMGSKKPVVGTGVKAFGSLERPHAYDEYQDNDEDGESGDEGEREAIPPNAVRPGRMRNVGLPLNYQPPPLPYRPAQPSAAAALANEQWRGGGVEPQGVPESGLESSEPFLDRTKRTCLLCRRQFANVETLEKHATMSELHKTNLAAQLGSAIGGEESRVEQSAPPAAMMDAAGSGQDCSSSTAPSTTTFIGPIDTGERRPKTYGSKRVQYRDRAKERRLLHGYDATGLAIDRDPREQEVDAEEMAAYKATTPLDDSNIGNRLLKGMGWKEGSGLGRNLQGIINPVQAEQRVQGVGLGASGSKIDVGATRKDRIRQSAIQRFNELNERGGRRGGDGEEE